MLERWISQELQKAVTRVPAVALLGPRRAGKTTLARQVGGERNSVYLDLESPEDMLKLRDPVSFLSRHGGKLVILDEIHRAPDLFMVLRGLIDENRRAGRKAGQFLLLGSAEMDMLRQSSESLAGRIQYVFMSGLNVLEVPCAGPDDLRRLWFRGGFPGSCLAPSDEESMRRVEMLIRECLERDVPQMGFRAPAARLRMLWTMLAHLQGETPNYSKLGGSLEIDGKTAARYLDILAGLLLVRRLSPWCGNVGKRLVRSPRFYVRDSGILHRLLGIADFDDLLSHPVLGKSWEGFVIENIFSVLPYNVESCYYRTSAGAEVDLVLRISSRELWAIDIRYGVAPRTGPGFHRAAEDINAARKFVVCSGSDEFPAGKDTTVVSLPKLMEKLLRL